MGVTSQLVAVSRVQRQHAGSVRVRGIDGERGGMVREFHNASATGGGCIGSVNCGVGAVGCMTLR